MEVVVRLLVGTVALVNMGNIGVGVAVDSQGRRVNNRANASQTRHIRLNLSRPPLSALQLITISLISTRVRLSGGVAVRSFREPLSRLTWLWGLCRFGG